MHFIAPESAVKCQKDSTSFSDVVILHRLSKDGAIYMRQTRVLTHAVSQTAQ
jgi:hypothetical protein